MKAGGCSKHHVVVAERLFARRLRMGGSRRLAPWFPLPDLRHAERGVGEGSRREHPAHSQRKEATSPDVEGSHKQDSRQEAGKEVTVAKKKKAATKKRRRAAKARRVGLPTIWLSNDIGQVVQSQELIAKNMERLYISTAKISGGRAEMQ